MYPNKGGGPTRVVSWTIPENDQKYRLLSIETSESGTGSHSFTRPSLHSMWWVKGFVTDSISTPGWTVSSVLYLGIVPGLSPLDLHIPFVMITDRTVMTNVFRHYTQRFHLGRNGFFRSSDYTTLTTRVRRSHS